MIFLYVSLLGMVMRKAGRPAIRMVHCVQRQPLASVAKPPTSGPMAGPRKGASRNRAEAAARLKGGKRSEFVPAPTARQPEPRMPARKRQTRSEARFWLKPAPRVKRRESGKKKR